MRAVMTRAQAKQATAARTPLVPIEYETALNALTACVTLDEAKYWSDKADALAAWAKIYHSDDAERKARMLKLHAYRRMGELAQQLRPGGGRHRVHETKKDRDNAWRERKRLGIPAPHTPLGSRPGPLSLLRENGLPPERARSALAVARLPEPIFAAAVNAKRPPSPTRLRDLSRESFLWRELNVQLHALRRFMQQHQPREVVQVAGSAVDTARELSIEIQEWLDEFERCLPKKKECKR